MGLSVLLTYSGILYLDYSNVPNTIPTHINYSGEIDSWGSKNSLWIAICVNMLLLLLVWVAIKFPRYWNYPYEMIKEKKNKFIEKFRLVLATMAVFISIAFSTMIFNAMSYSFYQTFKVLFFILIGPVIFLVFTGNKKTRQKTKPNN